MNKNQKNFLSDKFDTLRHMNWRFLGALALVATATLAGPVLGVVAGAYAASAVGLSGVAWVAGGVAGLVAGTMLSPFSRGFLEKSGFLRRKPKTAQPIQRPVPPAGPTTTASPAPAAKPIAPSFNDQSAQAPQNDNKLAEQPEVKKPAIPPTP